MNFTPWYTVEQLRSGEWSVCEPDGKGGSRNVLPFTFAGADAARDLADAMNRSRKKRGDPVGRSGP